MRLGLFSRALAIGAFTSGAALAQDECGGAVALAVGANPFSTVGATTSLPAFPCGSGGSDIWFTYTPTAFGTTVTIDTCGSTYDTVLQVLQGTCAGLVSVACNDDACGLQSRITFVANGGPYFVRVGGFNGASGTGAVNVTDVNLTDECAGAVPLSVGSNPLDTTTATSSVEPWCGAIFGGSDRWFTYTSSAFGSAVSIDTCGSFFDTVLEVYSGGCGALLSVGCNDDSTCGGFLSLQSSVVFNTGPAGTVYHVRVGGFAGNTGTGAINVSDVPPPPFMGELALIDCVGGTFLDISGTGTPLNISDDGEVNITTTVGNALFPPGTARVGSNGGIRFGGTGLGLGITNQQLPNSGAFNLTSQSLLPFWDDFDTEGGLWGNIYWQEISGTLYIQWQNAAFWNGSATADRATFQVQVHTSGPAFAQFLYTDIESLRASGGQSATIGYQGGGIGNDVQYSFNAQQAVSNGTVLSLIDKSAVTTFMSDSIPGTWIDISGTGTPLNLSDDGEVDIATTVGNALLAAGTVRVGSNGGVRFGGAGTNLAITNAAIPASGAFSLTSQALLGFWDDFDTEGGLWGNIYWAEVGGTLIIQWENAAFFNGSATQDRATFQIQVFQGGPLVAQFLYEDIESPRAGSGTSATIGYQAGGIAGNDVQWSFNSASVVDGTVLSICYANATVGTEYCIPVANSTGEPAHMFGTGTLSLAADDLVLNVVNLPANSFGYFSRGTATANTPLAGGGMGTLCIGGTVARGVGGAIVNSGASGSVSLPANLTALPSAGGPVSATVGQTIWLQYWYRDFVGGMGTSNLSNALQIRVGT